MSRQAKRALILLTRVAALGAAAALLAPAREEAPAPAATPELVFGTGKARSVSIENALDAFEVSDGAVTGVPPDILDAEKVRELIEQFDGLKPAK